MQTDGTKAVCGIDMLPLQVYSPPDDVAHAFHRVILLFVSPKVQLL